MKIFFQRLADMMLRLLVVVGPLTSGIFFVLLYFIAAPLLVGRGTGPMGHQIILLGGMFLAVFMIVIPGIPLVIRVFAHVAEKCEI